MLHGVGSHICLSIPSEPRKGMLYRAESHICFSFPSKPCKEMIYRVGPRIFSFSPSKSCAEMLCCVLLPPWAQSLGRRHLHPMILSMSTPCLLLIDRLLHTLLFARAGAVQLCCRTYADKTSGSIVHINCRFKASCWS